MKRIPINDYLMYHDVGRAIRREFGVGYQFNQSIEPIVEWAERNRGIFPGIYVPVYGPAKFWTKRDCFILMDCDNENYWNSPMVQAGINVWKNTNEVREFIEQWLEYCVDPRIISDQPSECGEELPEFREHRHDQSVLSNLLLKKDIAVFGDPVERNFKHRDVGFICTHVAVDKIVNKAPTTFQQIAEQHNSYRVDKGYTRFYQLMMEQQRQQPLHILELQSRESETSQIWNDYLPNVKVYRFGMTDADNKYAIDESRYLYRKVDLGHRPSLETICIQLQNQDILFDFIIDAGSGLMHDQQIAIGVLFKLLKPFGSFIMESMENSRPPGAIDLRKNGTNSTLQLVKKINLPEYQVSSHYFTRNESIFLQQVADTAGIAWYNSGKTGIGMIRRKRDE